MNMIATIQSDKRLMGAFSRAAAGKAVKFREECEFAKAIITRSPKLQRCTEESVRDSIMSVAHIGLSLNPTLSLAYLVPRGLKQKDAAGKDIWINTCTVMPSYRGLMKICEETGQLSHIAVDVVYEHDFIEIENGTQPVLKHRPYLRGNRGKKLGAYCVFTLNNGEKMLEWVHAEDMARIRAKAESDDVWREWEDEQWKKSAVRRLCKRAPKSMMTPNMEAVINHMNTYEGIAVKEESPSETISDDQVLALEAIPADFGLAVGTGLDKVLKAYGVQTLHSLPVDKFSEAKDRLTKFAEAKAAAAGGE